MCLRQLRKSLTSAKSCRQIFGGIRSVFGHKNKNPATNCSDEGSIMYRLGGDRLARFPLDRVYSGLLSVYQQVPVHFF